MTHFTSPWEQGFIDQRGNFLGRQEAWQVAQAAGQIIRRVGGDTEAGGTLYSEKPVLTFVVTARLEIGVSDSRLIAN